MIKSKRDFAVYFGNSPFKTEPLAVPSIGLGLAVPMVLGILAICLMSDVSGGALLASTSTLLAAAPAVKTEDAVPENIEELNAQVCELIKGLEAKVDAQCKEIEAKGAPNEKLAEEMEETKGTLDNFRTQLSELRTELRRNNPATETLDSVGQSLIDDANVKTFLERGWHQGHIAFNMKDLNLHERKTTITSSAVGSSTSGILTPTRVRDYVPAAEQRLTLRDLLPSTPVSSNAIEYPKENAFTNAASPQVEGSEKSESALTFTIGTANVRTIAHWIPATNQVLDDWPALRRIIDNKMMYGLKLKEEQEILTGSGSGQHLNGIQTQATSFETGRLVTNDTILDFLRHAISQVEEADEMCDFIVLHPSDFWQAMGLKDQSSNNGAYIAANPVMFTPQTNLWGKQVVVSNSQTADTFLVGATQQAEVFDRQQATIVLSTEHSDYFIKNLVAIRVEERIALAVYRTGAFVTGSLATASPL